MKKFISILLVLVMCLTVFSACVATPKPSPSLSPEELEKLEIQQYCDKLNDIETNSKNFRGYFLYQNTKNQLYYVYDITDVNNGKFRHFYYGYPKQTVGFGNTVDENGKRCFSSIQAIIDLGLFSVKVEDSFYERHDWDDSRYAYTWLDNENSYPGGLKADYFAESSEIVEFSDLSLIHKKLSMDDNVHYKILTQIGKVPYFDTSEIGYVETKNPKRSKENIEKVTIIPDPNLGK